MISQWLVKSEGPKSVCTNLWRVFWGFNMLQLKLLTFPMNDSWEHNSFPKSWKIKHSSNKRWELISNLRNHRNHQEIKNMKKLFHCFQQPQLWACGNHTCGLPTTKTLGSVFPSSWIIGAQHSGFRKHVPVFGVLWALFGFVRAFARSKCHDPKSTIHLQLIG